MDYLSELNDAQREAVCHVDGPAMIIAGPGSGKTRVLTYRIAYLIEQGKDPFNILALTFTNKAAREMKNRIQGIRGTEARNLWMGTFHSVFARILRTEADKIGYPNNFTIYDTDDSKSLIKAILKEQGLNDKLYKPNQVFYRISGAKNELITAHAYQEHQMIQADDAAAGRPKMGLLYELYAKRCFRAGAMDFDDLLLKMYELLSKHPEVLHKYQQYFRYIMIDEFQDTNYAQYAIVKKLGTVYHNVVVVGDDAQSIYSFRGANIQNILNFQKDFPDLKVFKMEQNYRSTGVIVDIANKVIAYNKNQLAKQIWTDNKGGEQVKILQAASDNEEGKIVGEAIFDQKMREHFRNSDFAILYRTNAQSRAMEESLRRLNIPYRIYGGVSFYQRKEIKDLLAYLKLIVNTSDEEALKRVINYPARGIGKTTVEKLTILANDHDMPIWSVLENIEDFPIGGRANKSLADFVTMIKSFIASQEKMDAYELASNIARSTGILKDLYADKSIEGLSRYENIQELLNSIKEFTDGNTVVMDVPEVASDKSLATYLQQVSLLTDQDQNAKDQDQVKLMTIHAAKGLEFASVFVVGLEENLFPSQLSMNTREELEEERRLFYVAVTRAEKKLTLSYAATRYRFGTLIYCEPSRFIDELPAEHLQYTKTPRKKSSAPNMFDSERVSRARKAPVIKKPEYHHKASDSFTPDDLNVLQTGMEVEHRKFGFGKVLNMEGDGKNKMATVFFRELGQKKLLLKFAQLRIVNN